jgi:hypothetical protein
MKRRSRPARRLPDDRSVSSVSRRADGLERIGPQVWRELERVRAKDKQLTVDEEADSWDAWFRILPT